MNVVVIGKTLADAQEFAEKWSLPDAQFISPNCYPRRYGTLRVDQFYVTPEAFKHPIIHKTVLTVQRFMQKQGSRATAG